MMESVSSSPRCFAEVILESPESSLHFKYFGPDFESVFDKARFFVLSHPDSYVCTLFEITNPGRVQKIESDGE